MFLAWGVLAGTGQFRAYGAVHSGEGVSRLAIALALGAAGVRTAGPFGLALAAGPLIGVALVARQLSRTELRGRDGSLTTLARELQHLLVASIIAATVMTGGPVMVRVLAGASHQAEASRFLAAAVLARIPLFLFNAVSATLLPGLADHAGSGRWREFRGSLRSLVELLALLTVTATLLAAAAGPWALRIAFGPGFVLPRPDLAALALSAGGFMVAISYGQALVALGRPRSVTWSWAAGAAALVATAAVGTGAVPRVAWGLVAAALVTVVAMAVDTTAHLRRVATPGAGEQ
jgi:O-antigen/teichoic acid export membrane protein